MDNLLIVDVPEGASKTEMYISEVKPIRTLDILCGLNPWNMEHKSISLPPGSWTIVEQTEEGAAKIMPSKPHEDQLFYTHDNTPETFETAIDALHSWIRSQGKEPKTSIILKKEI
jgi:hypothetical protein